MKTEHAQPEIVPARPVEASIPSLSRADDVNLRFGRIEERLASLEQMIGDLLGQGRMRTTNGAAAVAGPQTAPESIPSKHGPNTKLPSSWAQSGNDDELDSSVRDYVERLVRRDNPNPADVPDDAGARLNAAADEAADVEQESLSAGARRGTLAAEALDAATPPAVPAPLRPLREPDANLDALREVANQSATAAIRSFDKAQAARKTFDRLPLLLIGLVSGLMLLYSAVASGQTALFIGAGVAFLGAALTAWQVLVIFRRWLAASQPEEHR